MCNYFVMLNTACGGITPLTTDDEVAMFKTSAEAKTAGDDNLLGVVSGFEIFERGDGIDG